jgi:hypothetical protein
MGWGRGATALAVAALIGGVAVVAEPVAHAAGSTDCTFGFDVAASPGISNAPSSGTMVSQPQNRTMTCDGTFQGRPVSGPGTIDMRARYGVRRGDTCTSGGGGDGVSTLTVPTSGGATRVSNSFTFWFGPMVNGEMPGRFEGDRMSGTFTLRPYGPPVCSAARMTRLRLTGRGTLNG